MSVKQESLWSTLMTSIKAAYEYYYNETIDTSMLFGLTGFAFVTAISKGIGPCAPYAFNMTELIELVNQNIGLSIMHKEHAINNKSTEEDKQKASDQMKQYLDEGYLVLLNSYEFQLVTGYTDTHFITTIPWEDTSSVTPKIEINTMNGIKDFLLFSKIGKSEKIKLEEGVKKSIDFALHQYEDIETMKFLKQGFRAYDFWLAQMNQENYDQHGIWWIGNVWGEAREFASIYISKVKEMYSFKDAERLSELLKKSGGYFRRLSNKELDFDSKMNLLKELKVNELEIGRLY